MKRREPQISFRPFAALAACLREGYGKRELGRDVLAGLVVGVIALPLSMALAISSGVEPQRGLYTAVVAGALAALLGGSRVQVTGPTAAFVVLLAPVSAKYGIGGLALASLMAGLILTGMGLLRFGRFIEFIPHPVTTGFTAGIAVVIAVLQLRDLLGLDLSAMPDHMVEKVAALWAALPSWRWADAAVGAVTLGVLIGFPRAAGRKVPAALPALVIAAGLAAVLAWLSGMEVATIGSRFTWAVGEQMGRGIPPLPPLPVLPWNLPGADGQAIGLSWHLLGDLVPSALAIAMLGAIESLLSAVVADGMTGTRHDPDAELFAQGMGNLAAPLFGGFAATGAIARTAANIRSGGRSPVAAVVHALFVLTAMLALAPLLAYLPMAGLAALLLMVAWNMAEARHVARAVRTSPGSDVIVLVTCIVLTVVFDMVVAVGAGVVLASLLFMRRMIEVSHVRLISRRHHETQTDLPEGVLVYQIAGPLFFGAAQRAMEELHKLGNGVKVVILDLRDVPAIDSTGLVNLESALERLHKMGVTTVLAGIRRQPLTVLAQSRLKRDRKRLIVVSSFKRAVEVAREVGAAGGHPSAVPSPALPTAHPG